MKPIAAMSFAGALLFTLNFVPACSHSTTASQTMADASTFNMGINLQEVNTSNGVMLQITHVAQGGRADSAGLQVSDLISSISGIVTDSLNAYDNAIAQGLASGANQLSFKIVRNGDFVIIPVSVNGSIGGNPSGGGDDNNGPAGGNGGNDDNLWTDPVTNIQFRYIGVAYWKHAYDTCQSLGGFWTMPTADQLGMELVGRLFKSPLGAKIYVPASHAKQIWTADSKRVPSFPPQFTDYYGYDYQTEDMQIPRFDWNQDNLGRDVNPTICMSRPF